MAELGEGVMVGIIGPEDEECPFAHDKPGKVKNDLGTDAGKLGTRMTNGWSTALYKLNNGKVEAAENQPSGCEMPDTDCPDPPVTVDGNTYPYSKTAHHLIPGEASLPKSDLKEYIKDGSKIDGDIGYDVNGQENGVWLGTHHALSAEMKKGRLLPGRDSSIGYAALSKLVEKRPEEHDREMATFQERYTYEVMLHTNRQFHDSHPDYSSLVIKLLNKIHLVLAKSDIEFSCQKCKDAKSHGGKLPPPHSLVSRLNGVSSRLKGHLLGKPSGWHPMIFTSRFAPSLQADYLMWQKHGLFDR